MLLPHPGDEGPNMKDEFRDWLAKEGLTNVSQSTQLSQATRLEKAFGDLDVAFGADAFASVRNTLAYSKQDERDGRPNPAPFSIDGNLYSNLAGYRATLNYYERFRQAAFKAEPSTTTLNRSVLDELKEAFLRCFPDFQNFEMDEGGYWGEEREYKQVVLDRAATLVEAAEPGGLPIGRGLLELLWQPPANFVGWRSLAHFEGLSDQDKTLVAEALDELVHSDEPAALAAAHCAARLQNWFVGGALRTIVTTAQALVRPQDGFAVKTRYLQQAAKRLTGRGLFSAQVLTEAEYASLLDLATAIQTVMRDEWGWSPRDLWDVQGFLWVTSDVAKDDTDAEEGEAKMTAEPVASAEARNLILYGPPGTGKTWTTARRAVELCDGDAPQEREALMARYQDLVARKRIGFVTFHQSYAYEDFVEGLRPETGGDGESAAAGFSLKPHPGVFKRIAELAHANRGRSAVAPPSYRDRQVFKMSLGQSGHDDGERIYRDAIENDYVILGWGGEIDWSDKRYDDYAQIKARWQQDHPDATGNDPNIRQLYALRSWMKIGDLVVISDGNKKFRAIGEVVGPYQFTPREEPDFSHRRKVRWLWTSDEGLPRELIYGKGFSQVSIYNLDKGMIAWPALEQIISSGDRSAPSGEPEPYVLIIDEINRANVSKVFGELITLIEPDKRAGCDNALSVTLPYSGESFSVPANLHIVGTMNTADRSIALLDTALRRRFEFEELTPDASALAKASVMTGVDLVGALEGLNARIEYLFDRDHQIGHAFFIGCKTQSDVARVMRTRVIPLLVEYFYEDWEKVRQVLGETADEGAFIRRTKLKAPMDADGFESGDGRWRYSVRPEISVAAYAQLKA